MKRFLPSFLAMLTCIAGMNVWALEPNSNGVYEISSAEDFAAFAELVNGGNTTANAVLTADIMDYSGPVIGTTSLAYNGTFDGQGHKLNYTSVATERWWGLFRSLGGTVKNLRLSGSITTTFDACGGLAAHFNGGTIQNVDCGVDIISSFSGGATYGGIVCRVSAGGGTIKDCIFSGSIQGEKASGCACIAGWVPNAISMTNILIAGTMAVSESDGNVIARNPGNCSIQRCYYVNKFGSVPADMVQVTEEQVKSGEVCYLLNGDQTNIQWTQTLGTNDCPLPFPTGGTVYAFPSEGFRCDGLPQGNVTYGNTNPGMSTPPHTFANGVCSVCGTPDPNMATLVDGYYELGTPEQVIWFAKMVNNGEKSANARLVDDIDMRNYGETFPMIGTSTNHFGGTFDGQFHTITIDLVATGSGYGFFRYLDGTVKNLHIDGNLEVSYNKTGVIAAEIFGATIENCWSSVEINVLYVGDGAISGIASRGSGNGSIIRNCLFSGSIKGGAWNCAPILGWAGSGKTTIVNCLSIATIDTDHSQGNARPIARFDAASSTNIAECQNCYYVDPNGSLQNNGAVQVTKEQLKSGEVCYLLGGDFRQSIGNDEYPTLDPTHGIVNKIGTTGYATQYVADANVMIPEGVTVFTGLIDTPWIALNALSNIIPAGTAVVLQGSEGYYSFAPVAGTLETHENDLKGTTESLTADGKQYVLAEKNGQVGFYQAEAGTTIPAGKAYIEYAGTGVKGFFFNNADDIDQMVNDQMVDGKWYDLSGRRVEKLQKGIYIINGKKVMK